MENNQLSPIDMLLDDDNFDNIVLYNEDAKPMEFEQIALIPLDDKQYAILRPVKKLKGVANDEAVAFEVDVENDVINVVIDQKIVDKLFEVYTEMYEAE